MAGRSGAAAIAVALKEASQNFRPHELAKSLRQGQHPGVDQGAAEQCANALMDITSPIKITIADDEVYHLYAEGDKDYSLDVSSGVAIDLLSSGAVRGVSFYVE